MQQPSDRITSRLHAIAAIAALTAAYFALERVSSIHEYRGLPFTAWDPGLGLLFAAMILRPLQGYIALILGIVLAEFFVLHSSLDILNIVAVAIVISGVYMIVALRIGKIPRFDPSISRLRDILIVMAGALIGALATAALLTGLFLITNALKFAEIAAAIGQHMIGDVIGIAVMTPLALKIAAGPQSLWARPGKVFWIELTIFFIAASFFVWSATTLPIESSSQYFYLLFMPVMFSAVRHGLLGASIVLAAIQAILVIVLEWRQADSTLFAAYQTLMLMLTATGLTAGAIVSERDSSARIAETARQRVRDAEAATARIQRFNLVNSMASSLSHEISQPLTVARARARIVQKLAEDGKWAQASENISQLITHIDRAAAILQSTRDFLQRGATIRTPCHWREIQATSAALLAPHAASRHIALSWQSENDLPAVSCDPVQIGQIVVNLVTNAMDAIAAGKQTDGEVRICARSTDGKSLEISVSDNGPGVSPDIASRLFDAMATTRTDGLGLGLAICLSIVESHHGRLWLETSRPGNTDFRFRIPSSNGDMRE